MTATSLPLPAVRSDADRRPGMARLAAVELRKMVDTRAGFWLVLGIVFATSAVVIIGLATGVNASHAPGPVFHRALQPAGFLLPVMGVLLVTSEWSQRTALTTYALVPSRPRVLLAKIVAAVAVSVVALLVCLVMAEAGSAVATGSVDLPAVLIPQGFVFLATTMLVGVAFGTALLVSAPAIVAYLLLPTVWDALLSSIHALRHVGTWLDSTRTLGDLGRHAVSATGWLHIAATLAMWMVLPLLVGTWRVLRRDAG